MPRYSMNIAGTPIGGRGLPDVLTLVDGRHGNDFDLCEDGLTVLQLELLRERAAGPPGDTSIPLGIDAAKAIRAGAVISKLAE